MPDIHSGDGLNAPTVCGVPPQQGAGFARLAAVAPPAPCEPAHSRILRLPEVMARVGLSRASVYLYIGKGLFPRPVAIGRRAVGWLESEIDAWLAARIRERGA